MPRTQNVSDTLKQIRALENNIDHREFDRKLVKVYLGYRADTVPDDNCI